MEFWCVVPELSIERNDQSEPVWAGHFCEPANLSCRNHEQFPVQPCPHRDELAFAVWRGVRAGCDAADSEADVEPWVSRRVFDGLERGARPRRELHVRERSDFRPAACGA